jgi:hypothetical protein
MKPALQTRTGLVTLGLTGLSAMSACAPATRGPDADEMGACYRAIQVAAIAIQADGVELTPDEIALAADTLVEARTDIVLAWAAREGVALKRDDLTYETPLAVDFLRGIEAEAALSRQAIQNEMVEADEHPDQWSAKLDAAHACTGKIAS